MNLYLYIYNMGEMIEYVHKVDKLKIAPSWIGGYRLMEDSGSFHYMITLNEPFDGFVNGFLSLKELSKRDRRKVEMELIHRVKRGVR